MNFQEKVIQWKQLFLVDRQQAESFYYESLFPEVIDLFSARSKELGRYRYLISLLGFSPQPIILFIKGVQPEKVLFIHSEETEEYLDMIQKWTGLKLSQVDREKVESSDPTGVYKVIMEFVKNREPRKILLDISGGKKSMVGGAAMAGSLLNIDTGYVDYERYLQDLRQPEPGSEYPNILRNPLYVLGDIDLAKAREAFNHYNFIRCLNILDELEQRVEDIWGIRKLKTLAEIYHQLDSFNFQRASTLVEKFIEKYQDDKRWLSIEPIRRTGDILSVLINEQHVDYHPYMCLNYFFSGTRFAERARFDIAVFLMYRTIEMVLSIALKELGIDPAHPIYPAWLSEGKYNEKLREVFEKEYYEKRLPSKIGLMDSAILLAIKEHPLIEGLDLKEIKGVINLRNESIFTHGFRPLNETDYKRIKRMARKLLEKYLSLKKKPVVRDFESPFGFPKI